MLHRWLSIGTPERDRSDPAPELTTLSNAASKDAAA
jgi:hypothetical protein